MEEKEELNKQFVKLICLNILCFMIILAICGVFIFTYVRNSTYKVIDDELVRSVERIKEFDYSMENKRIENYEILDIIGEKIAEIESYEAGLFGSQEENQDENNKSTLKDFMLSKKVRNPNAIVILRDEDGSILNESELGRIGDVAQNIPFDKEKLGQIYEVAVANGKDYYYRMISSEIDTLDSSTFGTRYVQILINVDSEKAVIEQDFKIILTTILIGSLLSILASYLLSKNNLKDIQNNIEKQTEFVQNASHELRTPLTIIQAKQELLLQEPNAKIVDKSEDIALTLSETKRLSKLVKDLMVLTRSNNNAKLNKENVNIDEYLTNLVQPYTEIAKMQNKTINLNLKYNSDIDIDTSKIYQLMIILLDNAIKYTEEGDTIEVRSLQEGNKCVIEVADTGIGISDEGLKRVFERFYREDKARNRSTGGSGLGLSIASVIVKEHGGQIKASHNSPKGTVFSVKLPR